MGRFNQSTTSKMRQTTFFIMLILFSSYAYGLITHAGDVNIVSNDTINNNYTTNIFFTIDNRTLINLSGYAEVNESWINDTVDARATGVSDGQGFNESDGTINYTGGIIGINSSMWQERVEGTCGAGNSIRVIYENGSVTCEPDTDTDTQLSQSDVLTYMNVSNYFLFLVPYLLISDLNASMNQSTYCGNIDGATSNLCTLVDTSYPDTNCSGASCNVANTGTLDGYEAAALLDNTDTNASTACGVDEVLDGDGDCVSHASWITDGNTGWDNSYGFTDNNTRNHSTYCGNIDGATSNLCTITPTGGSQWTLHSNGWQINDSNTLNWNETKGNATYVNEGDDKDTNETPRVNALYALNLVNNQTMNQSTYCGNVDGATSNLCSIEDTTIPDTNCTGAICNVANTGTLDGYEAAALLDNTDTNASTACGVDEVLDGDGDCVSHASWITDGNTGWDNSYGFTDNNTRNHSTYCGNIDGATSNLCTITDTTIPDTNCSGASCNVANTGTLDGYEAAALLDNTDTNASTACNDDELLDGNGDCVDFSGWVSNETMNQSTYCGNIDGATSNLCTITDTTIPDTNCSGASCNVANTGTLDGYEAAALLDNTDTNASTACNDDELLDGNGDCVDFSGWDQNAADDFSGAYTDLTSKPPVLNTTTNFGGEVSGTYGAIVVDNDALDDQYEPISTHFDASTTVNITCFNVACSLYVNATDSCWYYPSGGRICDGS